MSRTITTAAELDALPEKSVLLDAGGWPVWRDPRFGWCASNGTRGIPSDLLVVDGGPLTLVHDPATPAPAPSVAPEAAVEALDALVEIAKVGVVGSVRQRVDDLAKDVRAGLAVVREHLPVKPGREDIYRAWHGTDDPWGGCADSARIERVLDLLPGRSEAEVKAEALNEAADRIEAFDGNDFLRALVGINGGATALLEYVLTTLREEPEGGVGRG